MGDGAFTIRGHFPNVPRATLPTPWKVIVFRLGTLTLGRVAPDLVRRLLQGALITAADHAVHVRAHHRLARGLDGVDRVVAERGAPRLVDLVAATDTTSIYVASSRIWQDAGRRPWDDLAASLPRASRPTAR